MCAQLFGRFRVHNDRGRGISHLRLAELGVGKSGCRKHRRNWWCSGGESIMRTFQRLFAISLFVALLAASTASVNVAAQDAPPAPDQQSAYPQSAYPSDQAPPPPASNSGPSVQDLPPNRADQGPSSTGDQSAYPSNQQAPPPPDGQSPSTGQQADPSSRVA